MADNRFSDYPTKRLPDRNASIMDYQTKRMPGKDELSELDDNIEPDDYQDQDYDPDFDDEVFDTKPSPPRYGVHRDEARRDEPRRRSTPPVRSSANRQRRSGSGSRRNNIKPMFAIAYIVLLMAVVGLCIFALFRGIQWMMTERPVIDNLPGPSVGSNGNDNEVIATGTRFRPPGIEQNFTAMITGISVSPRSLTLLNIQTGNMETRELPLAEDAGIVNRQNIALPFSNLFVGMLVEITYDPREPADIFNIRESVRAREHTGTNAMVNADNQTISVGHGSPLRFNSQTLVRQGDTPLNINDISPADSITILEYQGVAWHIRRDFSHGFLNVTNFDSIDNGIITVGTRQLLLADINEPITVAEGAHRVTVDGTNIETFIANIVIVQGQTLELSLAGAELRMGNLHIVTVPADAQIFVNGERHISPAILPFGEHTIRVERDGYYPYERVVALNTPISNVRFDLEAMRTTATLEIITYPAQAQIFINDVPVGFSTLTRELDPGTHLILARMSGYIDSTLSVTLTAGQNDSRTLTLTPVPYIPIPQPDPDPDPGSTDNDPPPAQHIPDDWPHPFPPPPPPPPVDTHIPIP